MLDFFFHEKSWGQTKSSSTSQPVFMWATLLQQHQSRRLQLHVVLQHVTNPVCHTEPCDPTAAKHCDVHNRESTLAGTAIARLVLSVMQVFKNTFLYLGVSEGGHTASICFWEMWTQSRSGLVTVSNLCLKSKANGAENVVWQLFFH